MFDLEYLSINACSRQVQPANFDETLLVEDHSWEIFSKKNANKNTIKNFLLVLL